VNQDFNSWSQYADWRTGIAALPQSKVYDAFVKLGLYLVGFDPTVPYAVNAQVRGTTYNVQVMGSDNTALELNMDDVAQDWNGHMGIGHGGNYSFYMGGTFNTFHVVDVANPYEKAVAGGEGHFDPFSPFGIGAPLHGVEWGLSNLLPSGNQQTFNCSVIGGCN
jgi:hypothetical protein